MSNMSLEVKTSSLGSKAVSVGKKVAPVLGALSGWGSAPEGANMGEKFKWIVNRLKGFKIADPIITTEIAFNNPEKYPIAQGIGLFITGSVVELFGEALHKKNKSDIGGLIKGLGGIAKSGGGSTAINAWAASYFYEAVNNPHPKGTAGYSGGSKSTINADNPQIHFAGSTAPMFSLEGGTL